MNEKKRKWLMEIDLIKASAIVLIVVGHLHNFLNIGYYTTFLESISIYIASIGLSLFFFVSGFSLYYNHISLPFKKISNFYWKRAVRIYPLFWLAIIVVITLSFYYYGFLMIWGAKVNFGYLLIAFLGLQGIFFSETPSVLYWFVGVILLYYFIYPFIIRYNNLIKMFIISVTIYCLLLFLRLKLNLIHPNYFLYYWTFISGIILCFLIYNSNFNLKRFSKYNKIIKDISISLTLLIFTIIYIKTSLISYVYVKYLILSISFVLPILAVYYAASIHKNMFEKKLNGLISKLSFSTYGTFLFFGPILFIMTVLLENLQLNTQLINYVIIIIGFPLVFFIGYYIQKLEINLRMKLRP